MRRNDLGFRAGIVALAFTAAMGCRTPKTTGVSVDVAQILTAEPFSEAPSPETPRPPRPAPGITTTVPAQPARTLSDPSRASTTSVRASIEAQQKEALQTLERRLREYYKTQIQQFELERQTELEAGRAEAYAQASDRIRQAFLAYADARAPKTLRLTVLVGFPDPNPDSVPPRTPVKTFLQKMLDEAKQLREELAQLDLELEGKTNAILTSVAEANAQDEAAMRVKVEEFRNQLNERASREAEAEVRTSVKELGLQLTDANPIVVPGTPSRRVEIPAEAPFPAAPKVPSVGIPHGLDDRRRLIEHELGIWLGLNRYRLEKGATDKTEEFQKWRQKQRAGL